MPTPPLVQSPRRQRQLVAVLMAGVFLASIGAAYLFSASRLSERNVQSQTVRFGRLQLQLPATWQRDRDAEQALGHRNTRIYRDPDRPRRTFRLVSAATQQRQSASTVLEQASPDLIGPQHTPTFQAFSLRLPSPGSALQVADVFGISHPDVEPENAGPEHVYLHLVAAMTVEGQRHWLLYLADRPEDDESVEELMNRNALLMRQIERFAAVGSTPANPGAGGNQPAEPEESEESDPNNSGSNEPAGDAESKQQTTP